MKYTEHTTEYINSLTLPERKKLGQYMTPQTVGTLMANMFTPTDKPITILDPAAGTGELLLAYKNAHPTQKLTIKGWDIDNGMLKTLNKNIPEVKTTQRSLYDPLTQQEENSIDRIIGNPPYYEIKKTNPNIKNLNYETTQEAGRINIYALFFEYALKTLKNGGELIFLVPPSMNNGKYFEKLRKHILTNAHIKNIQIIRDNTTFTDAQTATQIIHLVKNANKYKENKKKSKKFLFDFNKVNRKTEKTLPTIFTDNKKVLKKAWKNKKSLNDLGYQTKTGNTIWNKHKNAYQPTETNNNAPLIYSKDITKENKYQPKETLNQRRYLPLDLNGLHTTESVIVNRIVGGLNNPTLKYAHIKMNKYYTENHVNVITSINPDVSFKTLKKDLKKSKKLTKYLKALTGNTQLSATELQYMIPFSK